MISEESLKQLQRQEESTGLRPDVHCPTRIAVVANNKNGIWRAELLQLPLQ